MVLPAALNTASSPGGRRGAEADLHAPAPGVGHLRGDRALPDQLVEGPLVGAQLPGHLVGRAEAVAGGADGLVRLLGVLDLLVVAPGLVGHVVGPVQLGRLAAGGGDGGLRQRGAVGPHVGDVAVLVQALGRRHGALGGEAQLAPRLLLEGRGHERRVRAAAVGLLVDRADGEAAPGAGGRPARRRRRGRGRGRWPPVPSRPVSSKSLPVARRVPSTLTRVAPKRRGRLARLGERALDAGVGRAAEAHPGPLPLHQDAAGHALHPSRGQLGQDLAPQDGRHLVAVEAVEDAAGLLGVDQLAVEVAGVGQGGLDGGGGDLVEHHPPHRAPAWGARAPPAGARRWTPLRDPRRWRDRARRRP